jgi:hypothetical protein
MATRRAGPQMPSVLAPAPAAIVSVKDELASGAKEAMSEHLPFQLPDAGAGKFSNTFR